ncbi:MAG: DUF4240 domain-containing protein [Tannerella sp.]|jgi:hypothetical protein|nr:DUF4240 domain-containing protein [Tannerella sp.]
MKRLIPHMVIIPILSIAAIILISKYKYQSSDIPIKSTNEMNITSIEQSSYWSIVNAAAEKFSSDEDRYFDYVKLQLDALSYRDRYRFTQFTGEYMMHADCAGTMMLCKILNGGFTDDSYLYFTLWVLSRGKEFYLQTLANPDLLTDKLTRKDFGKEFEMFMTLGLDMEEDSDQYSDEEIASWDLTQEEKAAIAAEIRYLNGEQHGGYTSIPAMINDIPQKLPLLCKKFSISSADLKSIFDVDNDEDTVEETTSEFAEFDTALEACLHTDMAATKQWKTNLTVKTPQKIVGISFFMGETVDDNTLLVSLLYSRKKKFPAAIAGFNIITGENVNYYESSEEMIFYSICQSSEEIFIAGSYSGMATVDRYHTHILIFDRHMKLKDELKLPCDKGEHLQSGCHKGNSLYLSFTKTTQTGHGFSPKFETKEYTLELDLNTKQVVRRMEDVHHPKTGHETLYYLRNNPIYNNQYNYYSKWDLYRMADGKEELVLQQVSEFAVAGGKLIAIQSADNCYKITMVDIKQQQTQELLSLVNCEITNISATPEVLAFDIHSINGSSTFHKRTVFYHFGKQQYHIMNSDFMAGSIVGGGGFCSVIGNYYYAEINDWRNEDRLIETAYRGDLSELFN